MRQYLLSALIALDRFVNALLGGSHDETISARAARARAQNAIWGCLLCKLLDRVDPGHCDASMATDRRDAQALLDAYLKAKDAEEARKPKDAP